MIRASGVSVLLCYGILVCALLWGFNADASQIYIVKNQERIDVKVASKDINRIAVTNDRIKAVYGSQDRAHIVSDEENGQVFITPRHMGDKSFSISIVTEGGATVDLNLFPVNQTSETILLSIDKKTATEKKQSERKQEEEVKQLVKALLSDKPLKGYQVRDIEDASSDKDSKGMIQKKVYMGTQYNASIFTYTNLKDKKEVISEQTFKITDKVVGVAIASKSLAPGESTTVIVVEANGKR